jgi:hypothetical protein
LSAAVNVADVAPGDEWAVVEIMGHRRLVGRVVSEERYGAKGIRIDVPGLGDRCPECKGGGEVYLNVYGSTPATRPCKPCLGKGKRRDGVLEPEWVATQWYAGSALFAVTAITEEAARRQAQPNGRDASLTVLDVPFATPARRELPARSRRDDEGDGDDLPFDDRQQAE